MANSPPNVTGADIVTSASCLVPMLSVSEASFTVAVAAIVASPTASGIVAVRSACGVYVVEDDPL
jgi:hypothetical protein